MSHLNGCRRLRQHALCVRLPATVGNQAGFPETAHRPSSTHTSVPSAWQNGAVRQADAVRLLASPEIERHEPRTWADLGCGDGVFTRALASLLAPHSTIHAIDRDTAALRALPADEHGVVIRAWTGDVTEQPWPFGPVDGLLLANVLHYVRDQPSFLRGCRDQLTPAGHLLVVEYDMDRANPWVPYPVSRRVLTDLCASAGFERVVAVGSQESIYQRAPLYSAWVAKR